MWNDVPKDAQWVAAKNGRELGLSVSEVCAIMWPFFTAPTRSSYKGDTWYEIVRPDTRTDQFINNFVTNSVRDFIKNLGRLWNSHTVLIIPLGFISLFWVTELMYHGI